MLLLLLLAVKSLQSLSLPICSIIDLQENRLKNITLIAEYRGNCEVVWRVDNKIVDSKYTVRENLPNLNVVLTLVLGQTLQPENYSLAIVDQSCETSKQRRRRAEPTLINLFSAEIKRNTKSSE